MKKISKIFAAATSTLAIVAPIVTLAASCNKKPTVSTDAETVDKINKWITDASFRPNTMYELVSWLKEKHDFDLEGTNEQAQNEDQFVWDSDANVVFTLTVNDLVSYAPSTYTVNKDRQRIWKMVNIESNGKTQPFKEECPYGQYIKKGQTTTAKLKFSTSIDTGYNTGYTLEFVKATGYKLESEPKICTNRSKLIITDTTTDIAHYGNASSLFIKSMGTGKVYHEYGTVDGDVVLWAPNKFVAAPSSNINTIIINNNDASVDVQANDSGDKAKVGTVAAGDKVSPAEIKGKVSIDTKITKEEEKPKFKEDKPVTPPDPEPQEEPTFEGGLGTKESPWTINSKTQLRNCANLVNSQTTETYFYFKLVNDIDLGGAKFNPIGTDDNHPFRGVFDGNNCTISSLEIYNEKGEVKSGYIYQGLFGITNGVENESYKSSQAVWDDDTNELITKNITEDKYATVIKNLSIEDITINNLSMKDSGGLAGCTNNTYIENVQVKSGTINGWKNAGGLVGDFNGSTCINCTVGDTSTNEKTLKIILDRKSTEEAGYNSGGLIGNSGYRGSIRNPLDPSSVDKGYEAIIDCKTCSNVIIDVQDNNGGTIGGLVGVMQNSALGIISGCNNSANIEVSENSTGIVNDIAGILALTQRCYVLDRCNNYGNITTSETKAQTNFMAGIATYGEALFYKCNNYGKLSGYLPNYDVEKQTGTMAGIFANTYLGQKTHDLELINCVNEGKLDSKNEKAKVYQLCDGVSDATIDGETFSNVEALNDRLKQFSDAAMITIKNCTIADNTGTLKVPSTITTSIIADKKICSNIDVGENKNLYVNIPTLNITIDKQTECNLTSVGAECSITVAVGAKLNSAIVTGENSTITNNGTVTTRIGLDGASKQATNNGTCRNVSFGVNNAFGTGDKIFINNGTVLTVADDKYIHVLDSIGGSTCTVTIENHGTIEYQRGTGVANAAYLACLYNKTTPKYIRPLLKFYNGSKFKTDANLFFAVANPKEESGFPGHMYALEYEENAEIWSGEVKKEFPDFQSPLISVQKLIK